jgi:hypothetical protein
MSGKQQHHRPAPAPSPGQRIINAEQVIAELERKRQVLAEKAAEYNKARERLSYQAHVGHDAEASAQLSEARDAALQAERELSEIDSAISTAKTRLAQAQEAAQRDQRRAQIKEQQQRSKEFRQLGGYLDLHLDHVRRGLQALAANSHVVGKDHRFVFATHRILSVALAGTPFRDAFPVADSGDKRSFPSFTHVVGQWCDSFDANLRNELAALDGQQDEAA